MTKIPVSDDRSGQEHIVLPRGCTYQLGEGCGFWGQSIFLDAWPGDFHVLVNHCGHCSCATRGKHFPSAFDPAKRVEEVRPPPVK